MEPGSVLLQPSFVQLTLSEAEKYYETEQIQYVKEALMLGKCSVLHKEEAKQQNILIRNLILNNPCKICGLKKWFEGLLMNISGKWHCIEWEEANNSMERNQC